MSWWKISSPEVPSLPHVHLGCAGMMGKGQRAPKSWQPRCSLVSLLVCGIQQALCPSQQACQGYSHICHGQVEPWGRQCSAMLCLGPALPLVAQLWKEQFGATGASPAQPRGGHLDPDFFSQFVSPFPNPALTQSEPSLPEGPFLLPAEL